VVHRYEEIPAALHAAATSDVHNCWAVTNLSAMTVSFMFLGVTHTGGSSTDCTLAFAVVSSVVPLTSEDGGVWPARRYRASATAACASR
jgi:hypothetical protein